MKGQSGKSPKDDSRAVGHVESLSAVFLYFFFNEIKIKI
jgi:hypothetical protein